MILTLRRVIPAAFATEWVALPLLLNFFFFFVFVFVVDLIEAPLPWARSGTATPGASPQSGSTISSNQQLTASLLLSSLKLAFRVPRVRVRKYTYAGRRMKERTNQARSASTKPTRPRLLLLFQVLRPFLTADYHVSREQDEERARAQPL